MTAQIVEWVRIEDMPEEYRDGRDVVMANETVHDGFLQVVFWSDDGPVKGWEVKDASIIYPHGFFTHFMPKLLGPGDV